MRSSTVRNRRHSSGGLAAPLRWRCSGIDAARASPSRELLLEMLPASDFHAVLGEVEEGGARHGVSVRSIRLRCARRALRAAAGESACRGGGERGLREVDPGRRRVTG